MDKQICNCPFVSWCHEPRQWLQDEHRKENNLTIEDCWFYKEIYKIVKERDNK